MVVLRSSHLKACDHGNSNNDIKGETQHEQISAESGLISPTAKIANRTKVQKAPQFLLRSVTVCFDQLDLSPKLILSLSRCKRNAERLPAGCKKALNATPALTAHKTRRSQVHKPKSDREENQPPTRQWRIERHNKSSHLNRRPTCARRMSYISSAPRAQGMLNLFAHCQSRR